jgi:hypothetical protein
LTLEQIQESKWKSRQKFNFSPHLRRLMES